LSIRITLPDSETFVPEFDLNYFQFDIDFPSENLSSLSAAYDEWSFLDPDSPLQSDDENYDSFICPSEININAFLSYEIDSEPHESKQLLKRRERKVNSTFFEPPLGELRHLCIGVTLDKTSELHFDSVKLKYSNIRCRVVDLSNHTSLIGFSSQIHDSTSNIRVFDKSESQGCRNIDVERHVSITCIFI